MSSEIIPAKPRTWIAVAVFIIAASLWIGNWIYGIGLGPAERGSFGDMFGAVNALFSGLAFVGVIYAVILQRHELEIARQDIKFTKSILDEQQRQLIEQNKAAKKQVFETTFFQLLALVSDITDQMEIRETVSTSVTVTRKGKEVFGYYLHQFYSINYFSNEKRKSAYEIILRKINTSLGHYFWIIFSILEFIDKSEVKEKISIQISCGRNYRIRWWSFFFTMAYRNIEQQNSSAL